jgi:small subunit ribosomal protein S17
MIQKPNPAPAGKPAPSKAAPPPAAKRQEGPVPARGGAEAEAARENHRIRKIGVVTSNKMQKTIVVRVGYKFRHPRLGKVLERFVKFKAHDEKNEAKPGDTVEIEETRRLSKDKRWRLIAVLRRAAEAPPQLAEEAAA